MNNKDYSVWSSRELIEEIERLKREVKSKVEDKEYYTIMSICRGNLADIGVVNSRHLSDGLMEKIVSGMQAKYENYSDGEAFIEYLEKSVDDLEIERIEV